MNPYDKDGTFCGVYARLSGQPISKERDSCFVLEMETAGVVAPIQFNEFIHQLDVENSLYDISLSSGNGRMERDGAAEGAAAPACEGGEGYKDNFLSALIALTVCRLPPSWRSLIEITCT